LSTVVDLGNGIYQVDVHEMGMPQKTSAYVIKDRKTALVETGTTPGSKYLLSALDYLGIGWQDVDYIIVTHVHLDHCGAAGVLLRKFPNAQIWVHPRGARHLQDPSRLIAGTVALYGDLCEDYFGEVVGIPGERIYTPAHGEKLDLSEDRQLTFYHTLGHARHHIIIHDSASRGVFSGDVLGVKEQSLSESLNMEFVLPNTSPPEYDPDGLISSIALIESLHPDLIFFTHFGVGSDAPAIIKRNIQILQKENDLAREVISRGGTAKDLEDKLWGMIKDELLLYGLEVDPVFRRKLALPTYLSAEGIFNSIREREFKGGE